ncbi:MAG TPA: glycosyltransferase family 87 protein [Thermoanaerobaculia bacterium]|nr:glycosyltransferase family 87 protein [Thermoanaerobaculia bacterium]
MRRRLLWAAALFYSLLHFAITGVRQPLANFYGDFLASFPSWTMSFFFGRLDLYDGSLANQWGPPPIWHYGPVLHAITAPLMAFHSLRSAYVAWLFVNYLFVALTAVIAIRIIDKGRPTARTTLVVVFAFCNFNPLYEALTQRNIELFELLLLFAAYALLRSGRETTAGVAIGTAAMAKFLPLIFLPWFVLKRKWDALGGALAVIFPVAVVTEFVLEWENSGILIQLGQGSFLKGELNQSLAGMVARLLEWTHSRLPLAATSRVVILVALLAFSALMFRVRRWEGSEDVEYSLLAAAMVLLPPHNQNYYFVFLLLPYLLLYARYRTRWSWRAALLALSFLLVAMPVPLSIVQRLTGLDAFSLYLRAAIPFVGAVLLVIVLVAEIGMSCALFGSEQPCPSKRPSRISAPS